MSELRKGRVSLTFDGALSAYALASEADVPGLELVDIVVELEDRYLFVQVLDELDRGARSSELCAALARAFRDSMFYHLFGDWTPKRVEYAVLIPFGVEAPLVFALQDELRRRIPISHPSWSVDSAARASILTPESWRRRFGPTSVVIDESD